MVWCNLTYGYTVHAAPGVEQVLRQGEVPLVSNDVCQRKFWSVYKIHDSMVCAGGTGSKKILVGLQDPRLNGLRRRHRSQLVSGIVDLN